MHDLRLFNNQGKPLFCQPGLLYIFIETMNEIIKALMNLGSEMVTVHYRGGRTIKGRRQFIDVFSNTVIIKDLQEDTFHKINFEEIEQLELQEQGKEPRILKTTV